MASGSMLAKPSCPPEEGHRVRPRRPGASEGQFCSTSLDLDRRLKQQTDQEVDHDDENQTDTTNDLNDKENINSLQKINNQPFRRLTAIEHNHQVERRRATTTTTTTATTITTITTTNTARRRHRSAAGQNGAPCPLIRRLVLTGSMMVVLVSATTPTANTESSSLYQAANTMLDSGGGRNPLSGQQQLAGSVLTGAANQPLSLPQPPFLGPLSSIDWQRIGTNLMKQLGTSLTGGGGGGGGNSRMPGSHQQYQNRWVSLTTPSRGPSGGTPIGTRRPLMNLWDQSRVPGTGSSRPSANLSNRDSSLIRAFNQLRSRIGARNSIRVHNAFRDLAWRLLSGFSMPTPVIYELRRQHLYSPEEDEAQDRFWNRNTTKTIRTRRLLGSETGALKLAPTEQRRQADDDDESESLNERIRARLENLLLLSRRTLFGRVIRVPSLFPFKRQEADDEQSDDKQSGQESSSKRKSRRRRRFLLGRKPQEPERQMINIDGKQYYVDDDGELKELAPATNSAQKKTK